jgi:hypothetical protein
MLGVLAEGETPSASASADALMALNQMIDSWSTQNLSIYATSDQTFTWPANQATRTLGPSGNFVGFRPVILDDSCYFVVNGISYPIRLISDAEYNQIAAKTVQTGYPLVMQVNPLMPDISMTLWPVPNVALEMHLISGVVLSQPALLTTTLAFPPGYMRAFAYNLALELAPEFGTDPSKDVRRIAASSKHDIMRINSPIDTLQMPAGLVGPSRYNIFTGQ